MDRGPGKDKTVGRYQVTRKATGRYQVIREASNKFNVMHAADHEVVSSHRHLDVVQQTVVTPDTEVGKVTNKNG